MYDRLPDTVESERLVIRRFTEAELHDAYQLHRLDVVNQYLPYTTWTSYQDALDWYDRVLGVRKQKSAEQYAITQKPRADLIGTCIVFGLNEEESSAEFGYVLHPDYWGQGIMLEAMRVFTKELVTKRKCLLQSSGGKMEQVI